MTRKIKLNWETEPKRKNYNDDHLNHLRRVHMTTSYISSTNPTTGKIYRPLFIPRRKYKKIRKFWSSVKNWVKRKTSKNDIILPEASEETARIYETIYGVNQLQCNEDIPDTFISPIPSEAHDSSNEMISTDAYFRCI